MSTIRDSVAELYTPIYDRFLLQTFNEVTQVHPQVFNVIDDKTKEWKFDGLSGLGEWVDATEASGGGQEDPVLGYVKTLTQSKKWKKLQVSYEAVDQDEYAILSKEKDAKAIGRGARARVERNAASILYDGFSTAGADGQYLWDSDHPKNREETGVTYDNLLSGALSHDNLETAETEIATNFLDPKGIPIEPSENPILLYPPALRGTVARLFSDRANEQPDTTLRNINRFAGQYRPVEWRYLMAGLGGSNTAWYIIYPELELLVLVWSARPHFTSWTDDDLELYNFKGRMLYDVGACDWRCGFGSTGV